VFGLGLFHAVCTGLARALSRDIVPAPPYVPAEVREDLDRDPDLQELTAEEELAAEQCEREWDYAGNAKRFQEHYAMSEVPEHLQAELEPKIAAADAKANEAFFALRRAERERHREVMRKAFPPGGAS